MSKADRIRRAHAEEIARLQQKKQQEKTPPWVIALVSSVVGVIAVAVIVLLALNLSGTFLRNTVSAVGTSENERFEMDNGMMAYYYMTNYSRYVNQYGSYLSYLGLDTSDSLKGQDFYDGDSTWFEYFADMTKNEVEELIVTYLASKEAGYDDSANVQKNVDAAMANIADYAERSGYSLAKYIKLCYGTGVKEADVRRAMELFYTAQSFYNHCYDGYTYTEDDINAYFDKNGKSFMYYDMLSHSFKAEVTDKSTTAEKEAAIEKVEAAANAMLGLKTEKEFADYVENYLKAQGEKDSDIKTVLANLKGEDMVYDEDYKYADWAFEEGRKVGDVTVIYDKDTYTYTVYMITKLPARYEYNTVDVRHILFTKSVYGSDDAAKKKAEEILAAFEKDATAENFATLAGEYTEDTGSKMNGGLYEAVKQGEMVDEFNDWIFAAERKPGDAAIVKTDYGYHVMYFEGVNDPAWKIDVVTALKSEAYTETYEGFEKEIKVVFDDRKIKRLPF